MMRTVIAICALLLFMSGARAELSEGEVRLQIRELLSVADPELTSGLLGDILSITGQSIEDELTRTVLADDIARNQSTLTKEIVAAASARAFGGVGNPPIIP
jgi:hypothetical protein